MERGTEGQYYKWSIFFGGYVYLGNGDHCKRDDLLQGDVKRCVAYHDNAHINFVLHGACMKKKTSYERVPGKITYYTAKGPHQVMRVIQSSRHINLEIEETFFLKLFHISGSVLRTAITQNPDARFLW
jgi:hypothetical protein